MNKHGTRTETNDYNFIAKKDLHEVVPITFSGQQCEFVLGLFSKNVMSVEVLGVGCKAILDSILLQVLYMAVWRAVEVVRFYKDNYKSR